LGTILRSDLSWTDHVNYTAKKAWKALHFTKRIRKQENSNTKNLAYTSLLPPILEYGAARWDLFREGQVYALDRVQRKAAKFANLKNDWNWKTLALRRKIASICAVYKAYSGEPAWKAVSDRLKRQGRS
jgi:hypothetical protein